MKPLLLRAAELLEREAAVIADSYRTADGAWAPGDHAERDAHDQLIATAAELRSEQAERAYDTPGEDGYTPREMNSY